MKIMEVIHADGLEEGHVLAFSNGKSVRELPITSVFDTGHGRIQVETTGETIWLNATDQVIILVRAT